MFEASGAVKALNEEVSRSRFDVLQLTVSREINRNNLCNFVLIRLFYLGSSDSRIISFLV